MSAIISSFSTKNGKFSKTAVFLSIAIGIVLFLYLFQSLFVGATFFSWWTIPEFSSTAAGSILTIISGLYAINHGWVNKSNNSNEFNGEDLSK